MNSFFLSPSSCFHSLPDCFREEGATQVAVTPKSKMREGTTVVSFRAAEKGKKNFHFVSAFLSRLGGESYLIASWDNKQRTDPSEKEQILLSSSTKLIFNYAGGSRIITKMSHTWTKKGDPSSSS